MANQAEHSIEEVLETYVRTKDKNLLSRLIQYYRTLVKNTAERMYSKMPHDVDMDDLISAGMFGLMDALDSFNPDRGVKFEIYCIRRIS
jgi:RNA polymerase sigma factor for flagellar operon FliA